eukprot:CAMPEP_0115432184 /NCGR_PEP_ID=MMETSP0271-20121206/31965_1 /TAXON_ID=71861 /ORGANISM="Scrippsiella trochoidea, Strain CCMP3099" /LENGTH=328 /DNA_ID=CAMNT_0002857507 /DNA_START=66 /DNA_END=1052 /DNA_ORIENTATION=+
MAARVRAVLLIVVLALAAPGSCGQQDVEQACVAAGACEAGGVDDASAADDPLSALQLGLRSPLAAVSGEDADREEQEQSPDCDPFETCENVASTVTDLQTTAKKKTKWIERCEKKAKQQKPLYGECRCIHYVKCVLLKNKWKSFNKESYCKLGDELTDPVVALSGAEAVTSNDAAQWDWIWEAAANNNADECGKEKEHFCALLCNPKCKRSQDQLHIHTKRLSDAGKGVRKALQTFVCSTAYTDGWANVLTQVRGALTKTVVNYAKAKFVKQTQNEFPKVFSQVRSTNAGLKQNIGISVWKVICTKSKKGYVILATTSFLENAVFATR